jgi:hypothetical protein
MDPNDPRAAVEMLTVEIGQGKGRDVMETWFGRAMSADPDDVEACSAKLYYLEPKWYGNADEMLKFGRECLDSENWSCRIPLILADAHRSLSRYEQKPETYFKDPTVWQDIDKVYYGYLLAHPNDYEARSAYAYYACESDQWPTAKEQFDLLGDRAVMRAFGGREAYTYMKSQATSQPSDAQVPDDSN